jgi:hypothetical protein
MCHYYLQDIMSCLYDLFMTLWHIDKCDNVNNNVYCGIMGGE